MKIGKSVVLESLEHLCEDVIGIFWSIYLGTTTEVYVTNIMVEYKSRGFRRMLGLIKCMYWV